jgi:3-oxoacyl-[acyl-carrier-protein] synthase-3
MPDVFLHGIATAQGGQVELNTPEVLGVPAAQCERLVKKTGVLSRPIAAPGQTTTSLALEAVQKLLAAHPYVDKSDIGALIVCTQTPNHLIPGVSSRLHGLLDLPQGCFVMDINQGCSGFVLGTQTVAGLLPSLPSGKYAVLINADTYSRLVRKDDLTTRVLFGDAAAASLYSLEPGRLKLQYARSYADGSGYDHFVAHGSALEEVPQDKASGIYMDGPGILNFAMQAVPDSIHNALTDTGLTLDRISRVVFHQANYFVVEQLAKKLKLRPDQTPMNCSELGNTVSASVPLLLAEQIPQLAAADVVMTVGFGVGLSWGVSVYEAGS